MSQQELRIYKPNKSNNGTASKFQVVSKDKQSKDGKSFEQLMCFITMAAQTGVDGEGNAKFSWSIPDGEIIIKISTLDAATMLTAIVGMTPEAKLFHQNQNGNSTLTLTKADKAPGYYLNASSKKGEKLVKLSHSITPSEAILLKIYLEKFIEQYYAG